MTSEQHDTPSRAPIDRHLNAMYPALAMLAAIRLDVFTPLAEAPMDAEGLGRALDLPADKLEPLLYALVVAELLTVADGRFANTPATDHYLVRGQPGYIGSGTRLQTGVWHSDLRTAETILSGAPNARLDFAGMSETALMDFYRAEHGGALAEGRALVETLDLGRRGRLLDVAGGSGGLSIAACEACPGLCATVAELPSVAPLTRRFIAEAGMTERIEAVAVDLVAGPPDGSFDIAVLRNFIQVISRDQARRALRHVGRALAPGGEICIAGWVLDDSCLAPVEIAGSNFAFLNIYDEGRAYTEAEHRDWLAEAGFTDVERHVVAGGKSLVTARKA